MQPPPTESSTAANSFARDFVRVQPHCSVAALKCSRCSVAAGRVNVTYARRATSLRLPGSKHRCEGQKQQATLAWVACDCATEGDIHTIYRASQALWRLGIRRGQSFLLCRRAITPDRAARPVPKSAMVMGSGMGTGTGVGAGVAVGPTPGSGVGV